MLHVDVTLRDDVSAVAYHSVAVPPAFIADQSTESVLQAIKQRMGFFIWEGRACHVSRDVLVVNSDSHSALIRLAKHFAKQAHQAASEMETRRLQSGIISGNLHLSIHARCQMHQFFAALSRMVRGFEVINPMFCCTLLVHKGPTMRLLKAEVKSIVTERLRFTYTAVTPEDRAANLQLLAMLDHMDRFQAHECPLSSRQV
jgi:hypothetical protein